MSTGSSVANLWSVSSGASYCDIGYRRSDPPPTSEEPLGVPFPGNTWCEAPDKPNWVGHLVTQFKARRQQPAPLLVYDYALGGDMVAGVKRQIDRDFLPKLALKPETAPWTSTDTLFATWVGINDCAYNSAYQDPVAATTASITEFFELQEKVYAAGARNFCFINVPPTYEFPEGSKNPKAELSVLTWNVKLLETANTFAVAHPDCTIVVWSSWQFFHRVLGDPRSFGFQSADALFVDGLHPTSAFHKLIAAELLQFLADVRHVTPVGQSHSNEAAS